MPVTIADMQQRALTGPIMEEQDFNLKYAQILRRIVKEHEIDWPKEETIPDGKTADRIYEAGIDLINEIGLYHLDTNRVIHFTRGEVIEAAKTRPRELALGEGKDAVVLRERTPESPFGAAVFGFTGLVTEDMYIPVSLSHAIEPTCQGLGGAPVLSMHGLPNKTGTPGELYAVVAEVEQNRFVARLAGKPGMPFIEPMSCLSTWAVFAAFMQGGYTTTGTHVPCHLFSDFKLNWDRLTQAAFAQLFGIPSWNGCVIPLGGYTRNAAECAVAYVAANLGLLTYTHGHDCWIATADMKGERSSTRECMRTAAAASLALERNVHIPVGIHPVGLAGACTEMIFYELAAQILAGESSGCEFFFGAIPSQGLVFNGVTGMETRMMGETTHAVVGIKPERANELINKILEKYETQLTNPPKGKAFPECYDVGTIKPTEEYLRIFASAKEQLGRLGINFRY